jgi:uncharacterized phage protein gp47/JayE
MSMTRPTLPELKRQAAAELPLAGADDTLRRNLYTPLSTALAGAVHGLYGYQDTIAAEIFPETCSEERLLNVHAPFWLPNSGRTEATTARGTVLLTGNAGTATDAGTVFNRADGTQFALLTGGVVAGDGQLLASVVCLTAGQAGNTEPGGTLQLANPVAGLNSVATVQSPGLSGGADIEDIEDLRARVVAVRRNGGQVGRAVDWESWALEVPGVTRAWAAPKLMGAGSMTVYFMRDGDAAPYPDAAEQAAVQAYLETTGTPWGELFAVAPIRKLVPMSIKLVPDNASNRSAVTKALTVLFSSEASPVARDSEGRTTLPVSGVTILRSHITEAISGTTGEYDHTLSLPAGNVVCAIGELAELGTITWL